MSQQTGPARGTAVFDPSRLPPPSPPGFGGGRGPEPRRRLRRLVVVLAGVALLLLLLVLLAPTSLIDPLARRSVSAYGGSCAELLGVDVDSGAWPVVGRAAAGHHRDVSSHVDELRVDGFSYYDVSFSADRVDVAPLFGLLSDRETTVHGGRSSATVRFDDIEEVVAGYGTTVQLRRQDATLVADVEVPLLGPIPTTVEITPVDGDMELVFAPLDLVELPPVRVPFPAPAAFDAVEVGDDALRIDATVDGPLRSRELGCETASNPPR